MGSKANNNETLKFTLRDGLQIDRHTHTSDRCYVFYYRDLKYKAGFKEYAF